MLLTIKELHINSIQLEKKTRKINKTCSNIKMQKVLNALFLACFTVTRCTVTRFHGLFHACYTKVLYAISRTFQIIEMTLAKTD